MRTYLRIRWTAMAGPMLLAVFLALVLSVAPASAGSFGLGEAGNYNVFVFNDFTSRNSDTQGGIAAGGNVSLQSYGVGFGLPSGYSGSSLLVGGDLFYRNGQVNTGNITVGGNANINQSVGTSSGATVTGNVSGLSTTFATEQQKLTQLSQDLKNMAPTGQVKNEWGTLKINPEGSSNVLVFNINGAELSSSYGMAFASSIPSDVNIIFNISGSNVSMKNMGLQDLAALSDRVLFNFYEAEYLSLAGIAVNGSILAPNAIVDGNNGQMNGTLIAKSFSGGLEFHNVPFVGPEGDPGAPTPGVPEPATFLLLGTALGGLYWWRRRQHGPVAQAA